MSLVQSGDIEENKQQIGVINELQTVGDKMIDHVRLLHDYKNNHSISTQQGTSRIGSASSSLWGLFSSANNEEINENENENQIVTDLPPQYKALDLMKGVYLHGNPGTGKTYIMDMMYDQLPIRNKLRLHYNEFMLTIHQQEHKVNQMKDKSVDTISKVGNDF